MIDCGQGGLFVELTGYNRCRHVLQNNQHIKRTTTRKGYKAEVKTLLRCSNQQPDSSSKLSRAQVRRLEQKFAQVQQNAHKKLERKAKAEAFRNARNRCGDQRPSKAQFRREQRKQVTLEFQAKLREHRLAINDTIQISQGKAVIGRKKHPATLHRGAVVEIFAISRKTAYLIKTACSVRESIDHRAVFMRDKRGGRIGLMFLATHVFVPLKKIPSGTKFRILELGLAVVASSLKNQPLQVTKQFQALCA